jgi:hypothetical protein
MSKLVEIALAEVGTTEQGGNNNGDKVREYQAATWLTPDSWPWCAAFVCWVLREAWRGTPNEKNRCRDASAFGWIKWANTHGHQILSDASMARKGDIVVFDFSHIGIVVEDQHGSYINTVEGNTNGQGARDSDSGDGVWRKRRHRSSVRNYIRLKEV